MIMYRKTHGIQTDIEFCSFKRFELLKTKANRNIFLTFSYRENMKICKELQANLQGLLLRYN